MADSIYSSYPPPLNPAQERFLLSTIKDWTIQHGLTIRPNPSILSEYIEHRGVLATNAPVTLFPSPFPKSCFEEARAVQTLYNELYASIASDVIWLGKVIEELIDVDEFISSLWKVHLAVKQEGYVQDLSLGLFRSDYMIHSPPGSSMPSLKQVEFNTISASFGGLSALVTSMHSDLLSSPSGLPVSYPSHPVLDGKQPPANPAVETLCDGLAVAHRAYGPSKSNPVLPLCILFVVQKKERNIFDQLALSERLTIFHKIPVFRLLTSEILDWTSIPSTNPSRPLIYIPPHSPSTPLEVTTVYHRGFYGPADYESGRDWDARTHVERSAAIKCPSVLTQLSGCKKVQQLLAEPTGPDQLSRFFPDQHSDLVAKLRGTFAPQYDLSPNGRGRYLALNPETSVNHVLKPQREGGGNNIYKSSIPGFLHAMPETEWKRWVLMELIQPPAEARNIVLQSDGEVVDSHTVGELGVFGAILWGNDGKILHNTEGGWLMRTKGKGANEGGVAAGFSSLDSVVLF